jgi:arsenate reductase (glutaredoxin)
MSITIYHNPSCGTSRSVLALLRENGVEPIVVEYLKTPPEKAVLRALADAIGGVRPMLRERGTPYAELDLGNPKWSDDELLDKLVHHPILLNRPIVVSPLGARVCRPAETVRELLPAHI